MRRTLVSLSLALVNASLLSAQVPDTIRLANIHFVPRPGIDSAARASVRSARGAVHLLIQLSRPLTARERDQIAAELRMRVTQPLSSTLFIASVPAGPIGATLPAAVRWVGLIPGRAKVAREASPRATRPRTVVGRRDTAVFVVAFHRDVSVADQRASVLRHGPIRLARLDLINGFMVIVPPDSIPGLAEEDAVLWIEPGPRFSGGDNDFARSATGINADAVLAPSAYGLSGAGLTLAYWDGTIPFSHLDFRARLTNADGTLAWYSRNLMHADDVTANGKYDAGETMYIDMDDSETVSGGTDYKVVGNALVVVSAGAAADALVYFTENEMFVDSNGDGAFEPGESIYDDSVRDSVVNAGETLLTGSAATPGTRLLGMARDPHWHSTLVVGTMVGDGINSEAGSTGSLAPASSRQWKGIAPSASVSARAVCKTSCFNVPETRGSWIDSFFDEMVNATTIGGIAAYVNPWGPGGCHTFFLPTTCYQSISWGMDVIASARNADGSARQPPFRAILPVGSSGNDGYPERHTESVAEDGAFQAGESIYEDMDGDGVVNSAIDSLRAGAGAPDGAKLVDFRSDELHVTVDGDAGRFRSDLDVYGDVDGSKTVTANDHRLLVAGASRPPVAAGDADIGLPLRPFLLWGSVQVYIGAKNTLQVGAVPSDGMRALAFSSRGPSDDGRIKPEVVAAGYQIAGTGGVTSTYPRNGYRTTYGTSMSTGVAGGAVALLTEWYRAACRTDAYPSPELTRALLVHGADDLVDATLYAGAGPDYTSGFGRLRIKEAVDLVQHHLASELASEGGVSETSVTIPRMSRLKVTLAWSDPPWLPLAAVTSHGRLNNDLDLVVVSPDGRQYGPWLLDPLHPEVGATRASYGSGTTPARDTRNTIEQVVVDDAMPGTWKIRVTAGQMLLPRQGFTVVSEAIPPSMSPCTASPAGDVWVRDNDTDTGATPSTGAMWLGPDLWNRNDADGLSDHQNPEHGQTNYLYATVRNRGVFRVSSSTVELWIGDASTGLVWPTSYTYVGRAIVPALAPGEVRQVGPVAWSPPTPGHFCMYMRVLSVQDPLTAPEGASVTFNASNNNNIAYRNMNVVDLHSAHTVSFLVRNVDEVERLVDLVVRVPPEFLRRGVVDVSLSPALRNAWTTRSRPSPGLSVSPRVGVMAPSPAGQPVSTPGYAVGAPEAVFAGLRLKGRQAERVTITFASAASDSATFNVDVEQRAGTQVIGGIRYVVRTGRP